MGWEGTWLSEKLQNVPSRVTLKDEVVRLTEEEAMMDSVDDGEEDEAEEGAASMEGLAGEKMSSEGEDARAPEGEGPTSSGKQWPA